MSSNPTDDEVPGPDVNHSLPPEAPEADEVPLLHRRAYLRMGAAAVVAVGGSVSGLAGVAAGATKRAGITFAETIDMVEDAGCDPTGAEPIDRALERHADDDTLLEFPAGQYLVEREHEFEGIENVGIVGTGESRNDVEFVFPTGYSGIFLALWRGRNWLLENFTVQQSADHETGVGVVLVPYDNLQVRDFEIAGFSPWRSEGGQRAMYLDVLDADGQAVVDGYVRAGPSHMTDSTDNYSNGCQALLTDEYHRGTLVLRNCRIENASENAFYCSRGPGAVRIENCSFKNNDNAAVRISSNGSYIRDSTIIVDTENDHADNTGSYQNPRGLWVEDKGNGSTGAVADNCEFVLQSAPKIAGLLHVDASQGRFEAQNCRFYDGDAKDWSHLFVWLASPSSTAPDPADVTFSGCSFVADAAGSRPSIDLRGRSGSTLTNCCLSGTGDGVLLKDADDCVIEDTTISVDGDAIVYDNATAKTRKLTYEGACPLPEPLGESSSDEEETLDYSTITIESDGGGVAEYEFTVSGELEHGPESEDTIEGSTASGWVGPNRGVDDFYFTGEITAFDLDGPATVYVDGEEIDPDDYGQTEPEPSDGELIYIDGEELAAIESKVDAGDEPWASAWWSVKGSADEALGVSLKSTVEDGSGSHVFTRPDDYQLAIHTKNRTRDLALAYRLTGDSTYAQKAIDQLHHWFLNPDTYQEPVENGKFDTITQYITIPSFLYAASLLRGHPHWDSKPAGMPWNGDTAASAEAALEQWAVDWQSTFREPNCNNIYVWRAMARGVAGTYAGDDTVWDQALTEYRSDCTWDDYNDDGSFQYEIWRENGYRYQLFRMKAHAMFCEVGRARGLDLYAENDLKQAFDYMAPYVIDPSDWPHGTGSLDFDRNHEAGVYELAYSRWQDTSHLEVIEQVVGRPVDEGRLLGDSVTLTHGNGFEL